ncbi:MAG TPA: PSD1 and planctomycete cytochrome C domain-containing protein [Gemmataceae bacterium]|nr:PSD1 and planctomycete cytochrome C domain-containing protein [Gemmataceae bacterium]
MAEVAGGAVVRRVCGLLLIGWSVAVAVGAEPPKSPKAEPQLSREQAERLFATDILPILKEKCIACHGEDPKGPRGGLDLRSREKALAGGESGEPALVPGDVAKSLMLKAVAREGPKMPPKETDKLTTEQVATLRRWIAAGAPWPDAATIAKMRDQRWNDQPGSGLSVRTSGGLTPEWTNRRYDPADLWAYRPLRSAGVPVPIRSRLGRTPIDACVDAKLEAAGLTPAPEADKRTLIRRVTFDLIGLPPTSESIDAFLADDRPDAYERLVDQLLASPQYGEQQARHWLDVTRYADSAGFSNDFERPHAWRYRDYVVRSFNADKPFDRFALEQLAGDELAPNDPEMLIAVGYLRMGPWEHTAMSVGTVTRQQWLDDVTNAVGETFLAAPLACCRCHDHKFDPLPTRDYYRVQAVFATVQFADRDAPFLPAENTAGLNEFRRRIERLTGSMSNDLKLTFGPDATDQEKKEAELALRKLREKRRQALEREREYPKPLAMSLYDGPPIERRSPQPYHPVPKDRRGAVQEVFVLTGGSLESPSDKVAPGVLSAVGDIAIPTSAEGRRLSFARWVASPDNPLTARVFVNRIWQQHFGSGLVATPNNFGKMGRKPTHPELLDWLAAWFVEHGWSVKQLHRLIVTSAVYRRGGEPVDADVTAREDPDNRLLAYFPPRRLAAEELRDAMLSVSGELNPMPGGLPARPQINWEVATQPRHVMGSVAPAYQPDRTPAERHRRTLYSLKVRTLRDPGLSVFDQPPPDQSCERRSASTVAPQALCLLNSQDSQDRALAFARRLEREADSPAGRVDRAFRLVFGRPPTEAERVRSLAHVAAQIERHRRHVPTASPSPKEIERALVEEQTGTKIRWRERLDIFENYVPDLKPWDVGAETRALADLCLVLLNSNEFVYVY